ncbi:MAG: P1 family peptidase [Anaerovoracaceae bacterium]
MPHSGNLFKDKVTAGVSVINGFGKSTGLIQVEELGTIETPHNNDQHFRRRNEPDAQNICLSVTRI